MNILNKPINKVVPGNGKFAKTLSILLVLSFAFAAVATVASYNYYPFNHTTAVLQNLGRILWLALLVLVPFLSALQEDAYRAISFRKRKLDERQEYVRRRVFELSYQIAVVAVFVAMYLILTNKNWLREVIQSPIVSHDIYWIPIGLVLFLLALPPIIAAWRKDS